jgi:hypothetical protein
MTYIKEKGIKNLIIDLRTNDGGNSLLGDILLDYLTDKPFRQFGGGSIKFSKQAIEDRGYAGYEDMIGKLRRCSCDLKTPLENPLRFYGDV